MMIGICFSKYGDKWVCHLWLFLDVRLHSMISYLGLSYVHSWVSIIMGIVWNVELHHSQWYFNYCVPCIIKLPKVPNQYLSCQ